MACEGGGGSLYNAAISRYNEIYRTQDYFISVEIDTLKLGLLSINY